MLQKASKSFWMSLILSFALISILAFSKPADRNPDGAWIIENLDIPETNIPDKATGILLFAGKYYCWALFDKSQKQFYGAAGGTFKKGGNTVEYEVEYHTLRPELVGQRIILNKRGGNDRWTLRSPQGIAVEMKRMKEKAKSPITGGWKITSRETDVGIMQEIEQGSRKTIKLITNERFQWASFDLDSGEFYGTGGGTYVLNDSEYIETIEFFSEDSTRVNMDLTFDYRLEAGDMLYYSGTNSSGNPTKDAWERIN